MIVEDNAGWHRSSKVCLPLGIKFEPLPPYSPELQPAERLWKLVDEPLVNTYFETLDDLEKVLVERCRFLQENMQTQIRDFYQLSLVNLLKICCRPLPTWIPYYWVISSGVIGS